MLLETHTLELLLTGPESCLIPRSSAVITLAVLAYYAKKKIELKLTPRLTLTSARLGTMC